MKKQSFLRICVCLLVFATYAGSGFAHTITTPRGSTVSHSHPADLSAWWGEPYTSYDYEGDDEPDYVIKVDWTDWALDQWEDTYNLTFISASNTAFNCHAYTWVDARENDSGTWCWLSYADAEN